MKKQWFHINLKNEVPEIAILGLIGSGKDQIGYADFRDAFDNVIKPVGKGKFLINSAGGDMVTGFAIYDHVKQSDCEIDVEIIGMAASMSSIIAQCASPGKLMVSKNSLLMTHRPQASINGESQDLRATADLCDTLETRAKEIYKERSGKTDEIVNTWLKPGIAKWFTAKEAVACGLADGIIKDDRVKIAASHVTNEEDAWKIYNSIDEKTLFKQTDDTTMNEAQLKMMREKLQLSATATFEEVMAAVSASITNAATLADLRNQIGAKDLEIKNLKDAAADKEIDGMLNDAVREGKIVEGQRAEYKTLAKHDVATVKNLMDKMPKPAKIADELNNAATENQEEYKELAKMSWDELDKGGKLTVCKEKHAALYEMKYEAKFGKKPTKK